MAAAICAATLLPACDKVNDQEADAARAADASARPDAALADAGPPTGRDCKTIHALDPDAPSGMYTIDPDGVGGRDPFQAPCDMSLRGGGWTVVFLAPAPNQVMTPLDYDHATAALLDTAQEALVVYRKPDLSAYANDAVFDLPPAWKLGSPFDVPAVDVPIMVSINGAVPQSSTLRHGYANFSAYCGDDWVPASNYGRLCFTGTEGPFYSGFAVPSGDFCTDSSKPYTSVTCSDSVRFSIAVR